MASSAGLKTGFALRGSRGLWMVNGPPSPIEENSAFPQCGSPRCRVMAYSQDGSLLAYCDGYSVKVLQTSDFKVVLDLDKPRTGGLHFSSCNTLLATWEPYAVTKDQPAGTPNMHIWDLRTAQPLRSFVQKKAQGWNPQWSIDEVICARNVNNEVHFFENSQFEHPAHRLHLQKMSDFKIPQKAPPPYKVAVYVPGAKGQPSFVRLFQYPNFGGANTALASKSFYKSDKVDMLWNNKGSAVLLLTASDSATSESYYGEQGLHYMDISGESCLVPRAKNGPVYSVEWNPSSTDFCVVYGAMPAKATLYNLKCEPIFDFGTGARNVVYYNPFGNILCLAGFGNLRGNMEIWHLAGPQCTRLLGNIQAADSTFFEWSPDGTHLLTATTSPRLRVGNGYKIWHYTGQLLDQLQMGAGEELWEVAWQCAPPDAFSPPPLEVKRAATAAAGSAQQEEAKPKAYVPPALRNQEMTSKPRYKEAYEPASNLKQQQQPQESMSKAALKNKKKREAKARAKQAGDQDGDDRAAGPPKGAQAPPAQSMAGSGFASAPGTGALGDNEKKIRNIKKKLQQIAKLKEQQSAGKQLEVNQLEKLKTEEALLQELSELEIS